MTLQSGTLQLGRALKLALGGELPAEAVHARYAVWGPRGAPLVLLCPSMSNSAFVTHHPDMLKYHKQKQGCLWWTGIVGMGPKYGIDTSRYRLLCVAPLGSPFGSTSPLSLDPATGRPYGPTFPRITPADQARLYQLVLEHLGVPRAHAVVGGSMGGMAALEFAAQFPALYDRVAGIATTGRTSASTVALRYMQRGVVRLDPAFQQGHYHADHPPAEGMRQARMFGLLCYRSRGEFDARFDWLPGGDGTEHGIHRYLLHNSGKFGTSYDANCWLLLSECMDLMDLGRGHPSFALGAQRIPAEKDVMLLPYNTDELMPARELEMLGVALGGRPGAKVHFEVLSSPSGHDAFLINTPRETEALNMRLAAFLDGGVPAVRALLKEVE